MHKYFNMNHTVPIHDLYDIAKLEDSHAIWIILYTAHIDLRKDLAIGNATPADGGKRLDASGADVLQDARAPEDPCRRNAILCRS